MSYALDAARDGKQRLSLALQAIEGGTIAARAIDANREVAFAKMAVDSNASRIVALEQALQEMTNGQA